MTYRVAPHEARLPSVLADAEPTSRFDEVGAWWKLSIGAGIALFSGPALLDAATDRQVMNGVLCLVAGLAVFAKEALGRSKRSAFVVDHAQRLVGVYRGGKLVELVRSDLFAVSDEYAFASVLQSLILTGIAVLGGVCYLAKSCAEEDGTATILSAATLCTVTPALVWHAYAIVSTRIVSTGASSDCTWRVAARDLAKLDAPAFDPARTQIMEGPLGVAMPRASSVSPGRG